MALGPVAAVSEKGSARPTFSIRGGASERNGFPTIVKKR